MFDYLATGFQDPTPISIPDEKPIEASSDNEMQESCMKPNKFVEVKEYLPEVPCEQCAALNKLHEQLRSRAGKPLRNKHAEVLSGMVKVSVEGWRRSATLKGESSKYLSFEVGPTGSGNMNDQSCHTEEPQLTVYDPGGTLGWPTAHSEVAKNEGRPGMPARHADGVNGCTKQQIPDAHRVLLEEEQTRQSEWARGAHSHLNQVYHAIKTSKHW
ncbi:hypothetical protein F5141DRAFT_1069074 [Pisolithus sp. B1]|nr:hypothetical protein F5141DRAFT_1069074 [Pisolithus sp. B1]